MYEIQYVVNMYAYIYIHIYIYIFYSEKTRRCAHAFTERDIHLSEKDLHMHIEKDLHMHGE